MGTIPKVIPHLMFYVGLGAIAFGTYLIYKPAGIITAGILLAAGGVGRNILQDRKERSNRR